MRTIEEIRRARLKLLVKEFGSYAALNELLGLASRDSTLSQVGNAAANSETGKPRGMGSVLARRLEAIASKPPGWMDNDPDLIGSWPFPLVDRVRWDRLSDADQLHVQRAFNALLSQYDPPASGGSPLSTGDGAPAPLLHEPAKRFGTGG